MWSSVTGKILRSTFDGNQAAMKMMNLKGLTDQMAEPLKNFNVYQANDDDITWTREAHANRNGVRSLIVSNETCAAEISVQSEFPQELVQLDPNIFEKETADQLTWVQQQEEEGKIYKF